MMKHHISRRSRFFARMPHAMLLLGATALMLASCAEDGYDDDERFESGVAGATLQSPAADQITVTASADGKKQTITWPVVRGAGGYLFSFYDEGNMAEPLVRDSLVDGCSITVDREEDMNYVATILTKGRADAGNSDAAQATELKISTFTPTFMSIPAGADLAAWFAANPIPDAALTENLNYDLEGGANYTLSDRLDFDGHRVTLRSTSKSSHAKITYTSEKAEINTCAAMGIKYLDFDCGGMASNKGVFGFSKTPTVENDATYGAPIIWDPITIVNSNFDNVKGYFFWDNATKVAAKTMLVDNCVVHLTYSEAISGGVFWTNKAGHINDLTVQNSTFWESLGTEGDIKYFYQAGLTRAKDLGLASNSVNYMNCTFYHVCWKDGQWGNYNGMNGKADSYWVLTDCIFWDCSTSGSVPRRFLHGKANQPTATFRNNTYMNADGTFQDPQNYDTSGTNIEEDPQFANPAIGDFHISGPTQVARKTGDPRWLP